MTVERICGGEVYLARSNESVQAAAERMAAHNVGMLVVVDDAKEPIGILTDRDITVRLVARGLDAEQSSVETVMTRKPKTVPLDTPVEDALDMMRHHGVRRLPVRGRDGGLTGVVSVDDILKRLAEELTQAGRLLEKSVPKREE